MPHGDHARTPLRIARWRNRHLVPADHPAPERVRDRIDESVRRDLGEALADLAAFANSGEELVFVRRLELDLTVDAAWDRAAIAGAYAGALSRSLIRELARGASDNVVRFGSPADYVAAYVAARATGAAPLPWYLDRFRGWTYLTASAAIRSALTEAPEVGAEALRRLPPPALAAVALLLDQPDVAILERVLPIATAPEDHREGIRHLLATCARDMPPHQVIDRPGFVVWLAARAEGRVGWTDVRRVARLVPLIQRAAGGRIDTATALTAAADDWGLLDIVVRDAASGVDGTLQVAAAVARVLAGLETPETEATRFTRFGGAFLLMDDLLEMGLEECTANWPGPEGGATAGAALSLLTLGACLSSSHPEQVVADPVWRDLLRVPPQTTETCLDAWLDEFGSDRATALADAVLRRFAQRLPGFAASSAEFLRDNFLDVAARIDAEPDRLVVTLTRPTLGLILGLTGRNRGERRWPALDARPFVLFTEG